MQTLFLSDLHLGENTPKINSFFKKFIQYSQNNCESIDSIFILGDFFEFWVGDDYQSEFTKEIFNELGSLKKEYSIKCYFMHGNRDFLIGKGSQASFEQQTDFSIIDDPYCIEIEGEKILLSHGDSLCTDDIDYQKMRQMVRNELWQNDILSKSIPERIQIALTSRQQSQQKQQQLEGQEYIADVSQEAVNQMLKQYQCKTLIHGHTHRPDTHLFTLEGQQVKRIVLAAWYEQASFLKYENQNFSTVTL
ncbi:MAG: UDP-2,3-diacylglucosamine diphosphatase [Pseudomonadota bacterium]